MGRVMRIIEVTSLAKKGMETLKQWGFWKHGKTF